VVDRREELGFLGLDDPDAPRLLHEVPAGERDASWWLVLTDRSAVGRGTGGRELLQSLRLTRPFAGLLRLVPNAALDAAYGFIARHRRGLGRLVPDRPGPRRFP
jgi:predicted DCC family thiol-disulfide oxidoreductase YuxK